MLRGPKTVGGDGATLLNSKDVADGNSNTIQLVEACGTEIIWTEPKDVEVTHESLGINLPGRQSGTSIGIISSYHRGGANVLFCDGSVRFMNETTDKSVLRKLVTVRGGGRLPDE